jgi:hypothetical protein
VVCDIVEVWGTSAKPEVDAAIPQGLKGRLSKLKQWSSYKLLTNTNKTFEKKKAAKIALSKGSTTITLIEIVDKSKIRLEIDFAAAKGESKQKSLFDAGDWMSVGVTQPNGDGHLLAWTCK